MVRIAYALGGLGSGIVNNEEELKEKANVHFHLQARYL
jgi:carbamoylphosphate synthase large subunit